MKILILNWKDIKHSQAGGAEYATQELAQELVKLKHQVTIFTCSPKYLKSFEKIKGVNIIRLGNIITVYWKAYQYYKNNFHNFDIIIDQVHGFPFFTPLYVKKPILTYIHEIAGPIWYKEFNFIPAIIGQLIEKLYLYVYKNQYFLTDTNSTAQELQKHSINKKQIFILTLTIKPQKLLRILKSKTPLILYLGRITPMKQLDILLKSSKIIIEKIPNLQVYLMGKEKSQYLKYLIKLSKQLKIERNVKFFGNVTEKEKFIYFRKSWLQIHPSIKEGFGLTVLEAATQATPTISFNVPGLNNTIIDGVNGVLIKSQTSEKLAENIINLITDKNKLKLLQQSSYLWSKHLPIYKQQAKKLERILVSLVK